MSTADIVFYSFGDFARVEALFVPIMSLSEPADSQQLTAEDLLAWARSKPANASYDYHHGGRCAIALFLEDTGRFEQPFVTGSSYGDRNQQFALPAELDDAVYGKGRRSWTFAALVRRLEALLAIEPLPASRESSIHAPAPDGLALRPQSRWTRPDAYLPDIEWPDQRKQLETATT